MICDISGICVCCIEERKRKKKEASITKTVLVYHYNFNVPVYDRQASTSLISTEIALFYK